MNFEAIEKALLIMGNAMLTVIEKLDELIKIEREVLQELKNQNN